MYMDRETGVRMPRRASSSARAATAVEARASIDPEILRRWRDPAPDLDARDAEAPVAAPTIAPAGPPPADSPSDKPQTSPARRRKRAMIAVVLAIVAAGAGWFGYRWWTVGRFMVTTDDAYVRADNTTLAAKVSGYVANILVADNSYVHAGDVIAMLDDGDYRLAAESARQKVVTQQATVERIGRHSAQAGATRMGLELSRQQALAAKEFASRQALEQAVANRDQSGAAVNSGQAAIDAAQANVDVLKAQQREAERTLDELKTAQAKAERDLSFATIRAPIDGVIGNRAMQVGDFVQTGQRLASVVPLDGVYVDANLKETQLARLRPGQTVAIAVDALPGRTIEGTVASVAPASGSVFSLLPADNATGNFTGERLLRPGMSVVVSVDTRDQPQDGLPVLARGSAALN